MFIDSIIVWIYSNLFFLSISIISYFVVKEIFDEYEAKKKLPPGPRGLPFVGSLPFLGSEPPKTLIKYSKQHGNVFGSVFLIYLNFCIKKYLTIRNLNFFINFFCILICNNLVSICFQAIHKKFDE